MYEYLHALSFSFITKLQYNDKNTSVNTQNVTYHSRWAVMKICFSGIHRQTGYRDAKEVREISDSHGNKFEHGRLLRWWAM